MSVFMHGINSFDPNFTMIAPSVVLFLIATSVVFLHFLSRKPNTRTKKNIHVAPNAHSFESDDTPRDNYTHEYYTHEYSNVPLTNKKKGECI